MLRKVPTVFRKRGARNGPPPIAANPETIVVVGNGMVGFRFCEQLLARDRDRRYRLVVFGEEARVAYDRVHLSSGFNGTDPESLCLGGKDWYDRHGVQLHVSDPVVEIDRERRVVRSRRGVSVEYDRLVFATGAAPLVPSIPGSDLEGVFVYRTMADLLRIRAYATTSRSVALIGGGLLGLEAAKALHDRGLETHIVEFADTLLVRQLNVVAAEHLRSQIVKMGLRVHLGRDTRGIEVSGNERLLRFSDGETLSADMVVFAIGTRPRDQLAAACGLPCGIKGGIQVDDHLRTADERVYAIGECALHNGAFYGFVSPGYRMADVLVSNFLGEDRAFTDADTSTRLKIDGLEVNIVGDPARRGDSLTYISDGVYRQMVVSRGRVSSLAVVGSWPELGRLKDVCRSGRRISRRHLEGFLQTGSVWPDASGLDVLSWPSGAVVCECMGVTLRDLLQARDGSAVSVGTLKQRTGASTVCGSCGHLLARIAGEAAPEPGPWSRTLIVASAIAIAAGLATLIASPMPLSDSVRSGVFDTLWRVGFWKQVTGYVLAICCALSLVLSVRKRWRRFSVGSYQLWRAVHAGIGASSLLILFLHTGFRQGANFNRALMTTFLALVLLGGVAGLLTGLESQVARYITPRLRAFWTRAHVFLFWPVAVLILFHVISVYYF